MAEIDEPLLTPIDTERLRIRPLGPADLEDCHQLNVDLGWVDPTSTEAEQRERRRSWLAWMVDCYREFGRLHQPRYGERAIVRKADDRFVGLVGLVPSLVPMGQLDGYGALRGAPASPELGLFWAVAPALQRQGFATEAALAFMTHVARVLDARRLVATTEHDNAASIAVMRRIGMRCHLNPYPEPPWLQVVGVWDCPLVLPAPISPPPPAP
jgi:RimJ/RimL family protein N-acetyltransferase